MERNPAARAYEEIMKRVSENENEPVNTGGFLKRPVENSSIDANDVAGRAAHYFSQIHNERKKFNEEREKSGEDFFLQKGMPLPNFDEEGNPIQSEPFEFKPNRLWTVDEEGNPLPKGSPDDMIQLLPYPIPDKDED